MNRSPRRSTFRAIIVVLTVGFLAAGAFVAVRRSIPPRPLTAEETRGVMAAIEAFQPGARITNLRRDRDGIVRAFLPGDPLGGIGVAASNRNGVWKAEIEMLYF
jgi:hypothetical protein